MSLHEVILQRLKDFDEMFNGQGMWTDEQYIEIVAPLHQALLALAQAKLNESTKAT